MEKLVAIILNGEPLAPERLHRFLEKVQIIIAADGGANYCLQHNVQPHYIIGDLDSIHSEATRFSEQTKRIHLSDQYSTDLEKALNLATQLQVTHLRVANATGKRSDHAVANLLFLAEFSKKVPVEVFDNFGRLSFWGPGEHIFNLKVGTTVSFTSLKGVKNLTLEGFAYPLYNQQFNDFFVGISNVVTKQPCRVQFSEGLLMMYEVERLE